MKEDINKELINYYKNNMCINCKDICNKQLVIEETKESKYVKCLNYKSNIKKKKLKRVSYIKDIVMFEYEEEEK